MVQDQNSDDQKRGTQRAPRTAPLFDQQPPQSYKKYTRRNYDSWRDWGRFGLEIAAFVALVCYVHWTKDQSIATEIAAHAAKQSVDAAVAAVRPWLVLTETRSEVMQINNIPSDPMIPDAVIGYQNAGKTPATDILAYVEFQSVVIKPNFHPNFEGCPTKLARQDAVVEAGKDSLIYAIPFALSSNDRSLIDSCKAVLNLHGCIYYRDLFNPRTRHITEFTGFVNGWRGNTTPCLQHAQWKIFTAHSD